MQFFERLRQNEKSVYRRKKPAHFVKCADFNCFQIITHPEKSDSRASARERERRAHNSCVQMSSSRRQSRNETNNTNVALGSTTAGNMNETEAPSPKRRRRSAAARTSAGEALARPVAGDSSATPRTTIRTLAATDVGETPAARATRASLKPSSARAKPSAKPVEDTPRGLLRNVIATSGMLLTRAFATHNVLRRSSNAGSHQTPEKCHTRVVDSASCVSSGGTTCSFRHCSRCGSFASAGRDVCWHRPEKRTFVGGARAGHTCSWRHASVARTTSASVDRIAAPDSSSAAVSSTPRAGNDGTAAVLGAVTCETVCAQRHCHTPDYHREP
jgi:hypothetical protein